jgi:membrane-anchored glycerophosphoryl diester phosphodiesterase (GDPDase)
MGPLSVGNVVSAGLRLYRDHLKVYFGIACRATLWALLPFVVLIPIPLVLIYDQANPAILGLLIPAGLVLFVYGMAKYMVNSALISRLAFCELTNQPESARDARRQVSPKLWIFLRAYLLFLLLSFGIWIGFYLIALVLGILGGFLAVSVQDNMAILVVLGLIAIILFGIALSVIIRIFTRLFMYEVPLAIEEDITASQTIQRSWSLTKNHVGRVFLTLTVAFLISIPIYIIVQIIVSILQGVLLRVVAAEPTSVGFQILSIIVGYVLGLVSGALLLPFWQAIKAVVYYDLRSRREGLGMQLR